MQTDTQRQAYEVPGQHLRWRASQLQAQGLPYQVQPAGGGIYIVIVQQPPALDPWAYAPQRQQQRWPRWDAAVILPWLLVLAVASIMAGTAYMVAANAGQDAPAAQQAAAKDAAKEDAKNAGPFAWLADWRPPWAGSDKPAARGAQEGGWRWPWEDAADAAGALVADVQSTVTTVSSVILAVLVLMIVLTLVRKMGRRR